MRTGLQGFLERSIQKLLFGLIPLCPRSIGERQVIVGALELIAQLVQEVSGVQRHGKVHPDFDLSPCLGSWAKCGPSGSG